MRPRLAADAPSRSKTEFAGAHARATRRCSPKRRLLACTLAVWLLVPRGASRAQEGPSDRDAVIPAPTPPAAAVEHYERGRKEYLAGRYRDALTELKTALALDPNSPNLVYNVARVSEDLAELDEAIKYYRRYRLLLPPDAEEERDKTAKTIRRLQGAKDQRTQLQLELQRKLAKPKPARPRPPPSAGRADAAFWIVATTGLVLAAGGGVTGFLALRREKQVSDFVLGKHGTFETRESLRIEADQLALASDVTSVAAGVAILSAAVLFFSRTHQPDETEARLSIAPQAGGVGLRATF